MPDYEIVEWNEENFCLNAFPTAAAADKMRSYPFVTEMAQAYALYTRGVTATAHNDGEDARVLLVGTAFLAPVFSDPAVWTAPIDFAPPGSLVTLRVPTTDSFQILSLGAQGEHGRGSHLAWSVIDHLH